jgi:hypothetical protein
MTERSRVTVAAKFSSYKLLNVPADSVQEKSQLLSTVYPALVSGRSQITGNQESQLFHIFATS